jgi:predicted DNA-binding transcriptional regulator AlpA
MAAVRARLGVGRTTIWKLVRTGELPPPVKLTATARAWRASDIDRFIRERPSTR